MSKDTDETAREMLATRWWWDGTRMPDPHANNIETMAKFWLMRAEIVGELEGYEDLRGGEQTTNLLKRIAEVENGE